MEFPDEEGLPFWGEDSYQFELTERLDSIRQEGVLRLAEPEGIRELVFRETGWRPQRRRWSQSNPGIRIFYPDEARFLARGRIGLPHSDQLIHQLSRVWRSLGQSDTAPTSRESLSRERENPVELTPASLNQNRLRGYWEVPAARDTAARERAARCLVMGKVKSIYLLPFFVGMDQYWLRSLWLAGREELVFYAGHFWSRGDATGEVDNPGVLPVLVRMLGAIDSIDTIAGARERGNADPGGSGAGPESVHFFLKRDAVAQIQQWREDWQRRWQNQPGPNNSGHFS